MPFKVIPPLYNVWMGMKGRCRNPNNPQYKDYGGRGISFVDEWNSFSVFEKDMGPRPEGTTLDRIDNNAGYSPSNCRWATRREQQMNRRCTQYVDIDGTRYALADLVALSGQQAYVIKARISRGLTFDQVIASGKLPSRRFPVEAIASRVAKQKSATHCRRGHAFTAENSYFTPQGWRACRRCHAEKTARQRVKARNALAP